MVEDNSKIVLLALYEKHGNIAICSFAFGLLYCAFVQFILRYLLCLRAPFFMRFSVLCARAICLTYYSILDSQSQFTHTPHTTLPPPTNSVRAFTQFWFWRLFTVTIHYHCGSPYHGTYSLYSHLIPTSLYLLRWFFTYPSYLDACVLRSLFAIFYRFVWFVGLPFCIFVFGYVCVKQSVALVPTRKTKRTAALCVGCVPAFCVLYTAACVHACLALPFRFIFAAVLGSCLFPAVQVPLWTLFIFAFTTFCHVFFLLCIIVPVRSLVKNFSSLGCSSTHGLVLFLLPLRFTYPTFCPLFDPRFCYLYLFPILVIFILPLYYPFYLPHRLIYLVPLYPTSPVIYSLHYRFYLTTLQFLLPTDENTSSLL